MKKSKSHGRISTKEELPPLIQSNTLKQMFEKTLESKNQQKTTDQITSSHEPQKLLNSPKNLNMAMYNAGMAEQGKSDTNDIRQAVDKLLLDKRLVPKFTRKQLEKVGLDFEKTHIQKAKAYFFTIPNERSIDQLKEHNLNVTKSRKYCLKDKFKHMTPTITKDMQHEDVVEKGSCEYFVEQIKEKIEDRDRNTLNIIQNALEKFPHILDEFNLNGQTLFHKCLVENRFDLCNQLISIHSTISTKTQSNETNLMLQAKYLKIQDFAAIQDSSQGLSVQDNSNQNIVTHLFKKSMIDMFVESKCLDEFIKKSHSSQIRKKLQNDGILKEYQYLEKKIEGRDLVETKRKLPLNFSKNIQYLNKEIIKNIIDQFKINQYSQIDKIVNEQYNNACRIITIIEFLKKEEIEKLKNQTEEIDDAENEDIDSRNPPNFEEMVLKHLNPTDYFGNDPMQYAIKYKNIFLIIQLFLINQVKISWKLVDKYLVDHKLLDLDKIAVYQAVQKCGIFSEEMVKWIEETNLLNLLIQNDKNNLLPNPHLFKCDYSGLIDKIPNRFRQHEDNAQDQQGKQKIFSILKKITIERYVSHKNSQKTEMKDQFMALINKNQQESQSETYFQIKDKYSQGKNMTN